MPWSELVRRFDKRMAAAVEGLQEGLNWGELISAGGSPASVLALHTSHPSDQASSETPRHPQHPYTPYPCTAHTPYISSTLVQDCTRLLFSSGALSCVCWKRI